MQRFHYFYSQNFFAGIESRKDTFMELAQRHLFKKNSTIFLENDTGDSCFYVSSGLVRIFRTTASGKESILFIRRPGSMFGLAEVITASPRMVNAQALTPAIVYSIDSKKFNELLEKDYILASRVISVLGWRLRQLGEQVSTLMNCNVMSRLVRLLIYFTYEAIPKAARRNTGSCPPVCLSQSQIAAMVGSTQPTISSLLQQLQKEGLISVSRMQICILNPVALQYKADTLPQDML